jgi:hypothetical protein
LSSSRFSEAVGAPSSPPPQAPTIKAAVNTKPALFINLSVAECAARLPDRRANKKGRVPSGTRPSFSLWREA